MAGVCSICSAGPTRRDAINAAIVQGFSIRDVAAKYELSHSAVRRHKTECIPAVVAKSKAQPEEMTAESLLRTLLDVKQKAYEIYERNKGVDDGIALKALQRIDSTVQTSTRIVAVITDAGKNQGGKTIAEVLGEARARHNRLSRPDYPTRSLPAPVEIIDPEQAETPYP